MCYNLPRILIDRLTETGVRLEAQAHDSSLLVHPAMHRCSGPQRGAGLGIAHPLWRPDHPPSGIRAAHKLSAVGNALARFSARLVGRGTAPDPHRGADAGIRGLLPPGPALSPALILAFDAEHAHHFCVTGCPHLPELAYQPVATPMAGALPAPQRPAGGRYGSRRASMAGAPGGHPHRNPPVPAATRPAAPQSLPAAGGSPADCPGRRRQFCRPPGR